MFRRALVVLPLRVPKQIPLRPAVFSRRLISTGIDERLVESLKVNFADVPGVKTEGDKMVLMFTCKVCDTRSAKKISKQSYEKGVVIVRCACCNNKHLIADNMGIFEEKGWNIHEYLSSKEGEKSKVVVDDNVFELTLDDIVGTKGAVSGNPGSGTPTSDVDK